MPKAAVKSVPVLNSDYIHRYFQPAKDIYHLVRGNNEDFALYPLHLIDYYNPDIAEAPAHDRYLRIYGFNGQPQEYKTKWGLDLPGVEMELVGSVEYPNWPFPAAGVLLSILGTFGRPSYRIIAPTKEMMDDFILDLAKYCARKGLRNCCDYLVPLIKSNTKAKHADYEELKNWGGHYMNDKSLPLQERVRGAERMLYGYWGRSNVAEHCQPCLKVHPIQEEYAAMYLHANALVFPPDVWDVLEYFYGLQDGLEFGSSQWK